MNKGERDNYIDVIKAVGIISIVIGHASWDITIKNVTFHVGVFVYLYHLAIFLFCSGYLYKDKYTDIWNFIGKKLKGLYWPFIQYNILYLLVRTPLIQLGLVDGNAYNKSDYAIQLANIITFNSLGELLGAFWFLPMMFFSIVIFAAIRLFALKIKKKILCEAVCILGCGVAGIYGVLVTERQYGLLYALQISFLLVPVIASGFYFIKLQLIKYVHWIGLIISIGVMVYVIELDIGIIELSKCMIINRWLFYPVTLVGIYFCLAVGKYICKLKKLETIMAYIGKNSMRIMALHFFSFKIVDVIVCNIRGEQEIMRTFPHTYISLWPVYYVVGIGLPLLIGAIYDAIKRRCFHAI